MDKAFNERVRHTLRNHITVIVVRFVVHIDNRYIYIANTMPKQIDSHHRDSVSLMAVLVDIAFVAVLRTEILAETKSLRFEPCFLQFYENKMLLAVVFTNIGSKVYTEHGNLVPSLICIFMRTCRNAHYFFLQQC